MQINNNISSISFQSNGRRYKDQYGNTIGCFTRLFRDDLEWDELAKYEVKHFKNKDKVNIVMFAASDGSEAYSKIISLFSAAKNCVNKFFPIKAYDIDDEILKAAKSGYVQADDWDICEVRYRADNVDDFFEKTDQKMRIKNDAGSRGFTTLKARKKLTQNVEFNKSDIFREITKIKDSSNTVLMCRNILGYFLIDEMEDFIKLASKFLKKGSLFVIGDYDREYMSIDVLFKKYKFENIFKNVYKKL